MTSRDSQSPNLSSKTSTEADRELVRRLDGLYVGQLSDEEAASLNRAVADGVASYDYGTPAGFFLGLAKVRAL